MSYSRASSWPRAQTCVSCISCVSYVAGRSFTTSTTWKLNHFWRPGAKLPHAFLLASEGCRQSLPFPGLWQHHFSLCFHLHTAFSSVCLGSLFVLTSYYKSISLLDLGTTLIPSDLMSRPLIPSVYFKIRPHSEVPGGKKILRERYSTHNRVVSRNTHWSV